MSAKTSMNWQEANQRYLMARLLVVRDCLSRFVQKKRPQSAESFGPPLDDLLGAVNDAGNVMPAPAALDRLCKVFSLSSFERDVVVLCAGVELDATFAELCSVANGDSHRRYPTFSLALATLPDAHWSAITPASSLRYWRLVELGLSDSLTSSQLRIDERVLHYLAGVSELDSRLQGLIERIQLDSTIPASHQELGTNIARIWSQTNNVLMRPIVNLCGEQPAANHDVAAFVCQLIGVPLSLLRGADIPAAVAEREALARLWEREVALDGAALLVDSNELENDRPLTSFLENVRGMLFVVSREPLRLWRRRIIRFDVNKPSPLEQKALWQQALNSKTDLDGKLDLLVSQFSLGARAINAVSALSTINSTGESEAAELQLNPLWEACRLQARSRLDDLAQRILPFASWDDIVLPEAQRRTLREIAAHVTHRAKVYETWGFAGKGSRGLGISAMFAGVSGTGKTMAAEVLANDLNLDLYRIDLSQVVSKYIGETEKNLRRVFDAAEEGGAILLFDEADALFGKRTEVRDSHDRYANIEVSYLLQRMECYRGLAILTTNMKSVLDTAFMRRIRFIVHFPFPDTEQREEIWRRVFPQDTPTRDLDPRKLARLNVAGGNIRNIALHAAFLAADAREPVGMLHLLHAARGEYAKLEKPLTDSETAHWLQ